MSQLIRRTGSFFPVLLVYTVLPLILSANVPIERDDFISDCLMDFDTSDHCFRQYNISPDRNWVLKSRIYGLSAEFASNADSARLSLISRNDPINEIYLTSFYQVPGADRDSGVYLHIQNSFHVFSLDFGYMRRMVYTHKTWSANLDTVHISIKNSTINTQFNMWEMFSINLAGAKYSKRKSRKLPISAVKRNDYLTFSRRNVSSTLTTPFMYTYSRQRYNISPDQSYIIKTEQFIDTANESKCDSIILSAYVNRDTSNEKNVMTLYPSDTFYLMVNNQNSTIGPYSFLNSWQIGRVPYIHNTWSKDYNKFYLKVANSTINTITNRWEIFEIDIPSKESSDYKFQKDPFRSFCMNDTCFLHQYNISPDGKWALKAVTHGVAPYVGPDSAELSLIRGDITPYRNYHLGTFYRKDDSNGVRIDIQDDYYSGSSTTRRVIYSHCVWSKTCDTVFVKIAQSSINSDTDYYELFIVDISSITSDINWDPSAKIYKKYSLSNSPNPFSITTKIYYSIPASGSIILALYDNRGRLLREFRRLHRKAGRYYIQWDGRDRIGNKVASGEYFYKIIAGKNSFIKKMVYIK